MDQSGVSLKQEEEYRVSIGSLLILDECPRCFFNLIKKGLKPSSNYKPTIWERSSEKMARKMLDFYREKRTLPPFLSELKGNY